MNFESALEEIISRGWYIYSLHDNGPKSCRPDRWSCHLRLESQEPKVAYGQGFTYYLALSDAIDKIDRQELLEPKPIKIFEGESEHKQDLSSILSRLMNKPAIKRRI